MLQLTTVSQAQGSERRKARLGVLVNKAALTSILENTAH